MRFWRWWTDRFTGRSDRDLERELCAHLELEAEEQRDGGLPDDEARYAARRAFGNAALVKEDVREMWGWGPVERIIQDLRYAVRILVKAPAFTAVALDGFSQGNSRRSSWLIHYSPRSV